MQMLCLKRVLVWALCVCASSGARAGHAASGASDSLYGSSSRFVTDDVRLQTEAVRSWVSGWRVPEGFCWRPGLEQVLMDPLNKNTLTTVLQSPARYAVIPPAASRSVSICKPCFSSTDVRAKDSAQCYRLCARSRNTMLGSNHKISHVCTLTRTFVCA